MQAWLLFVVDDSPPLFFFFFFFTSIAKTLLMLDVPRLHDFYDLRVAFIAAVWLAVFVLIVAALHRCKRSHQQAPLLFHLASHAAMAAEVFAIIFAFASRSRYSAAVSDVVDPDEVRLSVAFQWVARSTVLVWLVLSRWLFYFVPRSVAGFSVVFPVVSEWTRVSLQLLYDADIEPVQLSVDCVVIVCQLASFCSLLSLKWLFLTDVNLLFRQIPDVYTAAEHGDSDDDAKSRAGSRPGLASANEGRARVSDTLPLDQDLTVEAAIEDMKAHWCRESIFWSLWSRWKSRLLMLALVRFLFDALGILPAFLLRVLVDNLSNTDSTTSADLRTSVVIIAVLILSSLVSTFMRVHYNLALQKISLYNRGLLSDAIARHVLRTRSSALVSAPNTRHVLKNSSDSASLTQGDIINHLTVDAQRIADSLGGLFDAWALPLQVALTLYLLYVQVNFAFVAGVVITAAIIPVNVILAKKIAKVNSEMLAFNDERVLRINEVVNNIMYVKMCGWSQRMACWIGEPRLRYMRCLRWVKMLDAACVFFWATTPVFVSLATFAMYIALGGSLTPGRAVAALSLFNALILPLNAYPWVINGSVEAFVSLRRLQNFLQSFIRKEQQFFRCVEDRIPPSSLWPTHSDAEAYSSSSASSSSNDEGDRVVLIRKKLQRTKRRKAHDDEADQQRSTSHPERSIPSIFNSAKKPEREASNDHSDALSAVSDVLVEVSHCEYGYRAAPDALGSLTLSDPSSEGVSDGYGVVDHGVCINSGSPQPRNAAVGAGDSVGVSSTDAGKKTHTFSVRVPSFIVKKGQLVTIAGSAGSGKTTFLNGLAGEVRRFGTNGRQYVNRVSVALVEQTNFLVHGSIRYNILCGSAFRQDMFDAVLKKCALDQDIASLELRENTMVGDGGAGLSGGQKFRVALARALYADKDLYLIDDGLGCLDASVAAHIVDHVYVGLARQGKAVVVVTHNSDLLHRSHRTYLVRQQQLTLMSSRDRDVYLARASGNHNEASPPRNQSERDQVSERSVVTLDEIVEQQASVSQQISVSLAEPESVGRRPPSAATSMTASEVGREVTGKGSITWTSIHYYLSHVGWCMVAVVVVFIIAMQLARNLGDWFVAVWAQDSNASPSQLIKTLGILAAANAVLAMVRGVTFAVAGLVAARTIHDNLLSAILSAGFQFFTTTSPGRLINRLSRDVYNIDDSLPFILNILLAQFFLLLGSVVIIVSNSSWVLAGLLLPVGFLNYLVQKPYRRVSREVKRLESAARSPVIDNIRRMLEGGRVLRTLGPEVMSVFLKKSRFDLVTFLRTNINICIMQAWFNIRLQLVGCLVLAAVGAVTVYYHTSAHAASLGLALAYVSPLTSYVAGLLSAVADTEKQFVSVERVVEYMSIDSETKTLAGGSNAAPLANGALNISGSVWPLFGTIQFNDVSLRYDTDGPLILRNVTFQIDAGEKVAIVGRTGAGKTSIFVALLRLLRLQKGSIHIDSEDIRRLEPDELRSRVAVFPQDPFIFHGSVRQNVDPFEAATDDEVSAALTRVQLGHLSQSFVVEEGGRNLSTGQRYLLALARVTLQQSCILLLDEPSAKIDKESDTLLWSLIDSLFVDSTVVTITHNLDHIDWFDRVVVLERGAVIGCGTPSEMRREKIGPFGAL